MIDYLLHLPYVAYWLPMLAATAVALPLGWFFRPARTVAAAPAAGEAPAEKAQPQYAPEQRRSFRRGGNSIGLLYKYTGQKNGPVQASILDRSMGGICVMAHEALPAGTLLSIRPTQADDIVPWVDAEVCTCRPCDDYFELGCRFVKTPPYSILLLFG
jgi:PilZ domain